MGGANSGVTDKTQEVFIESAHFNQSAIRKSSKRLGLSSDSSYRFERGVDPAQVVKASEMAARLIKNLAGGKIFDEIIICGTHDFPPRNIPMHLEKCKKNIRL
jgi:phenylalanyl-tRNA synthetase beta chain